MTTERASTIDVRTIAARDRRRVASGRFDALQPGEALPPVHDHDPRSLHQPFEQLRGVQCAWTCLRSGPASWHVQIGKTGPGTTEAFAGTFGSGGARKG